MASTDATFKFILISSIIMLMLLAVLSTLNCQQYAEKEDYSSYTGTTLNPELSNYWVPEANSIQSLLQEKLYGLLKGSFPMRYVAVVASSDVFVMPHDREVMKSLGIITQENLGLGSNLKELDDLACSVPASEYIADDTYHCTSVMQARSSNYPCKVRVFDANYRVCSTCFRVQGSVTGNTITIKSMGKIIYYLQPFAVFVNKMLAPTKVTNITVSTDGTTTLTASGLVAKNTGNIVLTVYYLDFVGSIMDVGQNPNAGSTVWAITSKVNTQTRSLTITGPNNSNPFTLGSSTTGSDDKVYPGIINAARLAVQFGMISDQAQIKTTPKDANYLANDNLKCIGPDPYDCNIDLGTVAPYSCFQPASVNN